MSLASLRVRLLILVLLAFVPAFGLLVYSALDQRRQSALEVQETALRLARLAASDQGRLIVETRQVLISLARLPQVHGRDASGCNALFASLRSEYPLYANLGAIDQDGRLFCSAIPVEGAVNLADRAYFRRALETGEFTIGDYQVGRVTKRATINVAQPAVDEDKRVQAVVFAALDLDWLNRFVSDARLPAGSTLTVVDGKGTILVRYPDSERWVGKALPEDSIVKTLLQDGAAGVAEATELDGVKRLIGFSQLAGTPATGAVHLTIGVPSATAFAAVNRRLVRNLVVLGVLAVLALVASRFAADAFVIRRVDQLVAATRRLAGGDLSARVEARPGGGELGELARAFDEMAAALERDRDERERNQREMERQRDALYRAERMADLGRLAAGVGHELKNPLAVIAARVELLRLMVEQGGVAPEPVARHVGSLGEASERMKRIMEGLSTYAKPPRPEPQRLDVGELLGSTGELVAYTARKHDVQVTVDVPEKVPAVVGDRSQLMQVLLNLATNAIEAMAETGGRVTLRARAETERVTIEVSDTGPGIEAERLERIWEPFYTSKPDGTGLGLSIVRALVEDQPGAAIIVTSTCGAGTTFTVTMPAATEEPEPHV